MVSASIVTYYPNLEALKRLLKTVEQSSIDKLYLIDNSSSEEVKKISNEFKKDQYIDAELNLGYGKGHNIGIDKSISEGYKYHIIINPDIFWEGDMITPMISYMDSHQDVGQLMPKILYPNGELQYLCKLLPTPYDLFARRFLPFKNLIDKINSDYEMHWTGYDRIMEVPVLSGCFMVLRNKVVEKVGGFDEQFFLYAEDVDLCRRIGEVSKTIYFPEVYVYHTYERGSYKANKLLWYHINSIIKYFNKWGWFYDSQRKKRNNYCIDNIREYTPNMVKSAL